MELKVWLKILARWWWLGAIPVVVVAAYVGLTYRAPATVYQSITRYTAGSAPAAELSADYDRHYAWLTSEYIARGLANIVNTDAFARAVAERVAAWDVDVAPAAIQGALVSDYAESVLVIYLTWPDAAQIEWIGRAVSDELTENGASYFPQMQGVGPVARRVDALEAFPLPPALRTQLLGPALRLALAAGVGLGLMALAHYADPRVRDRAEVEALGVAVIAAIPRR